MTGSTTPDDGTGPVPEAVTVDHLRALTALGGPVVATCAPIAATLNAEEWA